MASTLTTALENYIATTGGGDGLYATPMQDTFIMRSSRPVLPFRKLYRPSFCVVAQGAKQLRVGDQVLDYAAGSAVAVSVEVPGDGAVTKASAAEPFLGLSIDFDVGLLREVIAQLPAPPRATETQLGAFVETLSEPLGDCVVRLVRLLATPDAVPILHPAILKEIYFWLLTGPNGGEVSKIVRTDVHSRRIADAIHFLRRNYRRTIRVEEVAEAACMGVSSLHHHFKGITRLTPLQFQKQLRLLEARRLMVAESVSVTSAAMQVGYESVSQFSREYSRQFGTPPKRDAMALRALDLPRWAPAIAPFDDAPEATPPTEARTRTPQSYRPSGWPG
ncbi:AraC family transcriptional regulator [Acuticoccus sp. M5D2P5]|uniref:AraC family transcriptional regulator n=1 Tax=Acuticoccus kalidii TaxID=2910977 RepID=UPI001F15A157|nr:AraC family transcriptional regulator [Acuticoccus kalidii]MCF3934029.1 AraC family transcriptional regulator [Acuticoccus kalidii]